MGDKEENLYLLFGDNLGPSTSLDVLKKLHKEKALFWHPDKNKAPNAAEMFDRLTKAKEILLNEDTRAEHDKKIIARHKRQLDQEKLDAATRKLRSDVQRREEEFVTRKAQQTFKNMEEQSKAESDSFLQDMLARGAVKKTPLFTPKSSPAASRPASTFASPAPVSNMFAPAQIKVKWRETRNTAPLDGEDGNDAQPPYALTERPTEQSLRELFAACGSINDVFLFADKDVAIVVFIDAFAAEAAVEFADALRPLPGARKYYKLKASRMASSSSVSQPATPATSSSSSVPPSASKRPRYGVPFDIEEEQAQQHQTPFQSPLLNRGGPIFGGGVGALGVKTPARSSEPVVSDADYQADTLRRMMEAAARKSAQAATSSTNM